jgi:hypothetical protein
MPTMARLSPLRRFADHCLEGKLDEVVAELRAEGRGWEAIAREIWARTDHVIELSGQTLQGWYRDLPTR